MSPLSRAAQEFAKRFAADHATPVGTAGFKLSREGLFDHMAPGQVILEASSGGQVIRVEREDIPALSYYHWSPGTGSRVAKIDLRKTSASVFQIVMKWHPKRTQLCVIPIGLPDAEELTQEGRPTTRSYRVNRQNEIFQIGDDNVQVIEFELEIDGALVFLPTALEKWNATKSACETLQKGKSDEGYIFDNIMRNSIVTKLVTGFEVYCKTRFVELEQEGISPNISALAKAIRFSSESDQTFIGESENIARAQNMSILDLWINEQRRINFQNFAKVSNAFNRAYDLKFSSMGIGNDVVSDLKILFNHRHRVVHASPQTTLKPQNDPTVGLALHNRAISTFEKFIEALHKATLDLGVRPE